MPLKSQSITEEIIEETKSQDKKQQETNFSDKAPTWLRRSKSFQIVGAIVVFSLLILAFVGMRYFFNRNNQVNSLITSPTAQPNSSDMPVTPKLYSQMSEAEKESFIKGKVWEVEESIDDKSVDLSKEALQAIKIEIEDYVEETYSLSPRPYEDGLRVIYGRASQFAPVIARAYKAYRVPPVIGIYQAMIVSEYINCSSAEANPSGIFQFNQQTAAKYGITTKGFL
jgi:uncharacterized phage-associated protein